MEGKGGRSGGGGRCVCCCACAGSGETRVGVLAASRGDRGGFEAGSFVRLFTWIGRSAPHPWTGSTSRGFGLGGHAGMQPGRVVFTSLAASLWYSRGRQRQEDPVPWRVKLAWSGNGAALLGPLNFGFPEASNKTPQGGGAQLYKGVAVYHLLLLDTTIWEHFAWLKHPITLAV
jgi:hypothetical protein